MAGDLETDIDSFIQNQKQKLAQERSDLVQDEPVHERRTWDKPSPDKRVTVAEEVQRVPTPETGLPIGRNSYDARRKKLQDERRKEYNDLINKKPSPGSRRLPTPNGRSLPVGQGQDEMSQRRKVLQEERTQDYNNMIKKHTKTTVRPPTPDETGLPFGQYAEQRKKLEEERLTEYNVLLEKQRKTPTVKFKEEPDIKLIKDESEAVNDPRIQKRLNELSRLYYEQAPNNRYNEHTKELSNDTQYERSPGYARPNVLNDRQYERSPAYGLGNESSRDQNDRQHDRSHGYGHQNKLSRVHGDRHSEKSPGYGHPNDLSTVENDRHYERSPWRRHSNELTRFQNDGQYQYPQYEGNQSLNDFKASRSESSYPRTDNSPEKGKNSAYQQKGILSSRKENMPPKPPTPETFLSKLGTHDREKKRLNDERKNEYNRFMNEKAARGQKAPGRDRDTMAVPGLQDKQSEQPTRSSWEMKLFEDFLKQRHRRKKRRESKEKKYRQDSYVDSKPYSQEKVKKRNEEYNEFLRQKEQARGNKNNTPNDKHGGNYPTETRRHQVYYGTIPGLTHSRSADERERKLERNLEYREVVRIMNMSGDEGSEEPDIKPYSRVSDVAQEYGRYGNNPPGAPRVGWTTPTYDEILQKKQQEENRYRRYDDPELSRPGENGYGRQIPTHRSEGVLDDDNWRRSQHMKDDLYNALNNMRDSLAEVAVGTPSSEEQGKEGKVTQHQNDNPIVPAQQSKSQISPRRPLPEPVGKPRATLLIGHEETSSAKRRKKDAYRHDLEQQIQEHQDALKWEKNGDWRVNATGFLDPEKHPDRLRGLPASDSAHNIPRDSQRPGGVGGAPPVPAGIHLDYPSARTRPGYNNNTADPYFGALDQLSNRTDALLGRRGDLSFSGGGNGILERGWEGLYDRPRHPVKAPAGYENSSYLADIPGGYNAVNEAYHLHGLRNPLDPYNEQPSAQPYDVAPPGGRVRFDEPSGSPRKSDNRHHVLPYPVGDESPGKPRQKQDTQSYQVELQKQIEEQKMKKKREKAEQQRLDLKWEEENKNYNPFGRGGGGAPLKDSTGNTLADLRQLKITGPEASKSPRAPVQPASPRLVPNSPPLNVSGEATYARGGHGIFGVPKTYEEKTASDRYKDELRQQIEDKRSREAMEKQRLLEEEERENRRLEEQQQRIQHEFDEEQKKKRAKEEEARKRNEELQKLTEEKKKAAEHLKKEQDEKRLQELRERQDEERKQRERERAHTNQRSSPPVPAVKNKLAMDEDVLPAETANLSLVEREEDALPAETAPSLVEREQRGKSPVVPALRHKPSSTPPPPKTQPSPVPQQSQPRQQRASSADVLNQLATMRRQLQNERARVENALDRQKNDYEVFDPRLVQRPPVVPVPAPRREHEFEIFEGARNRAPVSVRRPAPPDSADPAIVNEFNYLKNKGSTDSRREVRRAYPESPRNSNDLETQQLELIKRQEEYLKNPAQKSIFEEALPSMAPRDLGLRKESPQALLQSESAFIDVNRVGSFPEDFDDLPRRNSSARERRRQKPEPAARYNPDNYSLTSNVSLDVGRISKKNEDRLKRLKQMTGDEVSLVDPDDVLDRFMSRQRHNRPPSGQTLKDDTWMRPDSRY